VAKKTRYRAAWLVPIVTSPIKNGWVDIEDGIVASIGNYEKSSECRSSDVDLGNSIVLPGLVNAHTHLELSDLRARVPISKSMPQWARHLMRKIGKNSPTENMIRLAVCELLDSGTVLVGDISNTLASVGVLKEAGLAGVVFKELLGFDVTSAQTLVSESLDQLQRLAGSGQKLRMSLAAHAPYSVSPDLFFALSEARAENKLGPISVHIAESSEELEFLATGQGPWRDMLEELGKWNTEWSPSSMSPVSYLQQFGWLGPDTLMVHGVQLTESDLSLMTNFGATLVTCPRSNNWTGAGSPPITDFYRSGVRIAVGTDSLASVDDLNLFSELREIRKLAPEIPAADILRSATKSGADALGFGNEFGAIAPGFSGSLISVSFNSNINDVEEFLVSGVCSEQVAWVGEEARGGI